MPKLFLCKEYKSIALILFFCLITSCSKKKTPVKADPGNKGAIVLSGEQQPPPLVQAEAFEPLNISFKQPDIPGGDLKFYFSLPMVEKDYLATAPIPKIYFHPEIKGSFKWKTATELVFSPEPEAMTWGQYISVVIDSAVPLMGEKFQLASWSTSFEVPYFQMAGKVASWPIYKDKPRFVAFLNWNTSQIGPGPVLVLYDQKFDAKPMIRGVKVYDSEGAPLPVKVFRPDTIDKSIDTNLTPEYCIALQVARLPEHGATLIVEIPSYESPDGLENVQRELIVNTNFTTARWGDYNYSFDEKKAAEEYGQQHIRQLAPLAYEWSALFSNNFYISDLKKALRINPQPLSMSFSSLYSYDETGDNCPGVTIAFTLNPGTTYRLSIPGSFQDILGNSLKTPIHTWFRTVDLPPSLQLPSENILIENQQTTIPVKVRNIKNLQTRVYSYSKPTDFAVALLSGKKRTMPDYGVTDSAASLPFTFTSTTGNKEEVVDIPLGEKYGLLCIEVSGEGTGSAGGDRFTDAILVQRTNWAVTAKVMQGKIFAWTTSLDKGSPVEGMKLSLYDGGKIVNSGVTDQAGVALLQADGLASAYGSARPFAIIAEKDSQITVASFLNGNLTEAWQFGIKGAVEGFQPLHASVFTERGVYRPGDSVYVKIISGSDDNASDKGLNVTIRDSRGQQVLSQKATLDSYNSANFSFKLKDQAPVGEYSVNISRYKKSAVTKFRVEEYRVPAFKVNVASEDKHWRVGDNVKGKITAKYLHGGTLDGREVRWEIIRQPVSFTPVGFEKYNFSYKDLIQSGGTLESGSKRLNGQGQIIIRFQPNHSSATGPMQYTIEATVTDIDRQAYSGRLTRTVHPADFYIGVKPPSRAVVRSGEMITVPVVALSTDEKVQSGVKVRVALERIDYHTAARMSGEGSVDMLNRPVIVPVDYQEITTGNAPVPYSFQTPSAGQFRLRLWSKDSQGRVVQTGFPITASGDNVSAWPRFDQDIIEIVADKQEYTPGDVAKFVVQSPYKKAEGIVTIEGEGWIEYIPFKIRNNTPSISIPVLDKYAPNAFVSVMLMRGRVHTEKDASGFETGAPGFKIGYRNIKVVPRDRKLDVAVTSRNVAQPGQKIKVSFSVGDYMKNPSEARITCMIVDEAVLGLTGYKTPDPLSAIYAERSLGVRTGTSVLDLPSAKRSRYEAVFAGGDMDKPDQQMEFSEVLRKLFKSTAYYNPGIQVGSDGKASIEFELPDNLTTYRIMAVAVDQKGRQGSTDKQVTIKKPLMTQPVVPRFVYPEDELQIEALVYNGTQNPGRVTVNCSCKGMKLIDSDTSRSADIKADGSVTIPFRVKVLQAEEAAIKFTASMGKFSDVVEIKVPILQPGNRRTIVQSHSPETFENIVVNIPADRIPGTASMEIVISNTPLSELKDAVQYLMQYPYGCIEQTTSTAYPLVVLKDLLPLIGVKVDMEDLKKFSEAGIRRILSFQTPSGGLSYWPGGQVPHAFGTAFGLTALIAAKERGYDVPDRDLMRMADYLEARLREGKITSEMDDCDLPDADTRALFVMTLGRLGRPQRGYIAELWKNRSKMTPFGLSLLAVAVKELPGDQSLLDPILSEVIKAAQQNQKEAWYTGNRQGGYSMGSPIRSHAAALLACATVGNSITSKLLAGLLNRRCGGMWGNTQENVFGIMGVHAAAVKGSGINESKFALTVNDKTYDENSLEKNSTQVWRLNLQESDLSLKKSGDSPQKIHLQYPVGALVYLTTRIQYDVPLAEENSEPQSNGFTLMRTYETLNGKPIEGKPIKLGSLTRVRLHIKTDKTCHYVALDDKLPAGLEPLNTSLETTQRVSKGELTAIEQRSLSLLSYHEIRDSRVAFFIDEMPPGEYEYTYVARATTDGTFLRPAVRVEKIYETDVFSTSSIDKVTIVPEK
jgi:uncharacterized protein YfaS (alpha-2-macroglobulin family)